MATAWRRRAPGSQYNRYRYYSPELGRYISADPIGQTAESNVFYYAFNNPLTWIDLFGLRFAVLGEPGPARDSVESGLESFRSTERGAEIEAATEGRLVPIEVNSEGKNNYDPDKDWIWVDPNSPECVETEDGLQNIPIEARIAHEGGHAIGGRDDGPGNMNNTNQNENPVREELGFPRRTKYPPPNSDAGCTCSDPDPTSRVP